MKVAIFKEHGDIDKLEITEIDIPKIGDYDVLINVKSLALNRLDLWVRKGSPHLKIPLPHVGGSDFAGIVKKIGSKVTKNSVGDRVVVNAGISCRICEACTSGEHSECPSFKLLGEHLHGGAAEYAAVPETNVLRLPDSIDFDMAAASALTALTSYRMIVTKGKIRSTDTVLVLGAGGGVGTISVQIAHHFGAKVIAVTSTDEKGKILKELGADHIVNYRENPKWDKEVWKLTNKKGIDIVVDSVGEHVWEQAIRSLNKGGRLITCGATSGTTGKINIAMLFWKQISIIGSTMASDKEFREAMQMVFTGKIKPVIDKIYPIEDIREAHNRLESGDHIGKIVLNI